jgi:ubiquinone/menaquinone biosynthesis C-methylase UbiE
MKSNPNYRAIAEYYDAENAHHRVLEEDVPFFLGQLPRKKQEILELAVGTARAAIPLAQAGHRVVGVDYAADMLEIARRKRDGVGLGDKQLALIKSDVISLDLERKFDWVCVFFNTFLAFTTLAQQDAVLQRALAHLKPRGRFWLDIFQPDMRLLCEPRRDDLDPSVFFVPRFDRTVLKTTDIRRASSPQLQHVSFHYTWFGPHGQPHHEQTRFDMTYIFPRELRLLLERNGLEIEHLWGNYDGSTLTPESPRMIARCCRA